MLVALRSRTHTHTHTHTHMSPPPPSCSVPRRLTPLGCITWILDGFGQWEPREGWESRRNESQGISSLFPPCFGSWYWQWLGPSVTLGQPPWVQVSPTSGPTLPLLDPLGLWVFRTSCGCLSLGNSTVFFVP